MEHQETAICPLCQGPGRLVLSQPDRLMGVHPENEHRLFHCPECSLFYQEKVDPTTLGDYYPTHYYGRDQAEHDNRPSWVSKARQINRARSASAGMSPGRVLDIGCGRGEFLLAMRERGWTPVGTDWNADNAANVSAKFGMQVIGGADALTKLEPRTFDLITMFHVLEHDQEPWLLLKHALDLLKPGGRLLVAVPNAGSVVRTVMGDDWTGYDLPRHRYGFTVQSLTKLLDESGFVLERIRGRLTDELLDIRRSIQLRLDGVSQWSNAVSSLITIGASPAVVVLSSARRGSVMYAYARRPA